jgi:hypothetical protein
MSYPDVTAAVLHTLCDVYQHIAVRDDAGLKIYFHFDYEDDNVRIVGERADQGEVTIVTKAPENVFIRIPTWAPLESVKLTVGDQAVPVEKIGHFAFVPRTDSTPPPEIVLRYALPERTTSETVNGIEYRYKWRGDEIIGALPNTPNRPMYPTITDGE